MNKKRHKKIDYRSSSSVYLDRYGSTSFTGLYGTYLYTEYPACPANIHVVS